MRNASLISITVLGLLLAGCGGGSNTLYKSAKSNEPLEIPPNLSVPVGGEAENMPALPENMISDAQGNTVLLESANVEIKGHGDQRWLLINASPEEVWQQVRGFFVGRGYELKIEEPAIGIMETGWLERNTDVPEGGIRGMLARAFSGLYSIPYRDKFRVRLERAGENQTELYLTHYGVEQVEAESAYESEKAVWRVRPSDTEVANEMLQRILLQFGVGEEASGRMLANGDQASRRAEFVTADGEDQPMTVIYEGFARGWRLVGLALDRTGVVVEDRDRSQGLYYVRKVNQLEDAGVAQEKGFFATLFSDDEEADAILWRIKVEAMSGETHVTLLNNDGSIADRDVAERVLKKIAAELE